MRLPWPAMYRQMPGYIPLYAVPWDNCRSLLTRGCQNPLRYVTGGPIAATIAHCRIAWDVTERGWLVPYRTGQLTAEERAQRLAEMTGNASVHDEARWSRQRRAREVDEAEEAANQRKNAGNDLVVFTIQLTFNSFSTSHRSCADLSGIHQSLEMRTAAAVGPFVTSSLQGRHPGRS